MNTNNQRFVICFDCFDCFITNIKDSINSLCQNLTGFTADKIIIRDKDWWYIARRFASADAAICNEPEWFVNPTEALEANEKTFEGFTEAFKPASCSGYTLAQLFMYIFGENAEEALNETLLDGDANEKLNNKIYKKLAEAIIKAYLSSYNKKNSPQAFLEGKVEGSIDISDYQKYLCYVIKARR